MSNARKSGVLLPGALIAGNLVLAAALYGVLSLTPGAPRLNEPATVQQAASVEEPPFEPGFRMPPASDFSEIVERPLFSPNRRPAPEDEVSLDAVAAELDLKLVGIILSSNEPIAIVAPKSGTTFVRLTEGDRFQGWTVAEIEPHRVTFQRDELLEHLELSYDQPPARKRRAAKAREPNPQSQQDQQGQQGQQDQQVDQGDQGDQGDTNAKQ